MNAFGLTGNIGCGKSTVASLLASYPDVLVLDCDRIAKEIISDTSGDPGGAHRQRINEILGTDVFAIGKADFQAIAKIIFTDRAKKTSFEAYIHPLVWETVQDTVNACSDSTICVVESAIIYEIGSEHTFTAMIVASCNRTEQIRRLRNNRQMKNADIDARIKEQLPQEEKIKQAQFVISTDCSLDQLNDAVHTLYKNLKHFRKIT